MQRKILAVCQSKEKGTVKKNIGSGIFVKNYGLKNDAHGGKWHRQVSLLGIESINKMRREDFEIGFGKKCHHDCEIKKKIGECVMPREGIFTRVLRGGMVQTGDIIEVI